MDLREYLFFNKITQSKFSEDIQCTRSYLSGIIHKKIKPSKRLAKSIEIVTNGEVKVEDLLKGFPDEEKKTED